MNKKVLMLTITLLGISMIAIPIMAEAKKSKAVFAVMAYDLVQVESETKQVGKFTVETSKWTAQLRVFGAAVSMGMLPSYGGTAEVCVTKRFDPETGYGSYKSLATWDFDTYGSFKVRSLGKCAGYVPGLAPLGWYSQNDVYGFGIGALFHTRFRCISSIQIDLPPSYVPAEFVDTNGRYFVGEIIY
jgi:hypothetical protein